MKIAVRTLVGSFNSLQVLSSLKIPAKTAFKITRVMKKVKEEMDVFEELKRRLVDEYGIVEDNKEFKVIPKDSEHFENVDSELNSVLDTEVEFSFEPISVEELGNVEIEPVHLHVLEYMFV